MFEGCLTSTALLQNFQICHRGLAVTRHLVVNIELVAHGPRERRDKASVPANAHNSVTH